MRNPNGRKIIFLVAFWLLCAVFIVLYDNALLRYTHTPLNPTRSFWRDLFLALGVAFVGGTAAASFDVLVLSRWFRRRPLGRTILTKAAFWLVCIVVLNSVAQVLILSSQSGASLFGAEVRRRYVEYLSSPYVIMTTAYWGAVVLIALFVVQVGEKFGQGVLLSFLMGKYHQPKEEDRIFLFIDLKSSTTYAEALGHMQYSRLLQDCFYDLTDVVVAHQAVIYQYVGDEVVLTWDLETGLHEANCVRSFFAFDRALKARHEHYESRYGLVPEFKAGLNAGRVTAAEVGEIKKELAYHGDVLNTASRIQGKCNEFGTQILISESLCHLMHEHPGFNFGLVGSVELRGRQQPVRVYEAVEA
ncbi:MAG: adenylate/guanylate cyclase domain-containing protein [Gemmatimonadota bacterium]